MMSNTFLLSFAEGKDAMKNGSGSFSMVASNRYHGLEEEERERLVNKARLTVERPMTPRDIKKAGARIFSKVGSLVNTYAHCSGTYSPRKGQPLSKEHCPCPQKLTSLQY